MISLCCHGLTNHPRLSYTVEVYFGFVSLWKQQIFIFTTIIWEFESSGWTRRTPAWSSVCLCGSHSLLHATSCFVRNQIQHDWIFIEEVCRRALMLCKLLIWRLIHIMFNIHFCLVRATDIIDPLDFTAIDAPNRNKFRSILATVLQDTTESPSTADIFQLYRQAERQHHIKCMQKWRFRDKASGRISAHELLLSKYLYACISNWFIVYEKRKKKYERISNKNNTHRGVLGGATHTHTYTHHCS